jgi:hypothetical protein
VPTLDDTRCFGRTAHPSRDMDTAELDHKEATLAAELKKFLNHALGNMAPVGRRFSSSAGRRANRQECAKSGRRPAITCRVAQLSPPALRVGPQLSPKSPPRGERGPMQLLLEHVRECKREAKSTKLHPRKILHSW